VLVRHHRLEYVLDHDGRSRRYDDLHERHRLECADEHGLALSTRCR
jgi:hypothetical protein